MTQEDDNATEATEEHLDWTKEPAPVYANIVQVLAGSHDFAIAFGELRKPVGGVIKPGNPVVNRFGASVRMTPQVFLRMVTTMAEQWNRFALALGMEDEMPAFRHISVAELKAQRSADESEDPDDA